MGWKMKAVSKKLGLRLAALTVATVGLSGCVYDLGLGYYDDGYSYYDCDPYSPFDSYYACDSGYGFYNIGFGGGWYDNYWYPGYGYYIFDNYGRRHTMHDRHRRYWGDRRQRWYRDNGRDHDGRGRGHRRGDGRGHGYGYNGSPGGVDQPIGWPEKHGGRRSERPGRPAQAAPPPDPTQAVGQPNWGGERNDDRRGGRGEGRGRGRWGNDGAGQPQGAVAQPPQPDQPVFQPQRPPRGDGAGNGGGRGAWQGGGNGSQGGQAAPPPPPPPRAEPPPPQPRHSPPQERSPDRLPD